MNKEIDNMQIELKNDIGIINNKYIINKNGEIYRITKNGLRFQKPRKHTNGYLRATINGKDKYIHRLVAMTFIDNPNNYNEISHEDNNKENNNVENLKWCDRQYNNKKMFIDGIKTKEDMSRISKRPKYKLRKISDEILKEIRKYLKLNYTDYKISKLTNISRGSIKLIREGKTYCE